MLAKPLVACTYLSSIVSELFEPQVQKKITIFTYRSSHFLSNYFDLLFPLETPLRLSRNMLHEWKDNAVLAKPLAACTHLQWPTSV